MARTFDDAGTQRLEIDSAALTAYPFTMACWFKSDDAAVAQTLMMIADKDVSNHKHALQARGDVASDPVRCFSVGGGAAGTANTSTGYSTGTWHHACAVFASATSRAVFIDGASKGTNASNITPSGLDRTSIGRDGSSSPGQYMSGDIAWAAVWNVALADAEVTLLAKGLYPPLIRPDALVAFWPLWGRHSPEVDLIGRLELTVTGATVADQPRVYTPIRQTFAKRTSAFVLAAEPGSYAITGSPMSPLAGRLLSADPGSYAVAGSAAGVLAGRKVDADPGAYTVAGSAAALLAARRIAAAPGAYTVAGSAAQVLAGRLLAAVAGTYAVTGSDASLIFTGAGAFTLNAEPGVYVITGAAAALEADRVLAAEPGAYLVVGSDSALGAARLLEALPGSYLLVGSDAGLLAGRRLEAEPGSYGITGAIAGLLAGRLLQAAPGVYLVTGAAATLAASGGAIVAGGRSYATNIRFRLAGVTGIRHLMARVSGIAYRQGDTTDVEDHSG